MYTIFIRNHISLLYFNNTSKYSLFKIHFYFCVVLVTFKYVFFYTTSLQLSVNM